MRPSEPILHVDMDAFFASVEQRDDPSLRGRPVAVGGRGERAVVAAASYEARAYGLRSAMPMVRARRLCPDLVVLPARFEVYRAASEAVMEVLRSFTPLVEPLSLDEAFLDVSGAGRIFGDPVGIGHAIRAAVRERVDLPCSVGIGPTTHVAKLCSGDAKPDGVAVLRAGEVAAALAPRPVGDLHGAGPRTVERLATYGFTTIGQLAAADPRTLARVVGEDRAGYLRRLARGEGGRRVAPGEGVRSVGASSTFAEDVDDPVVLQRQLLRLSERVGRRLRRGGHAGRTVVLTVRFSSFSTVTRSRTLPTPTDSTRDVAGTAGALLEALRLERARVRLLGVRVEGLVDGVGARQPSFDVDPRWEDVERVADAVATRFDDVGVSYAALLDDEDLPLAPTAEDLGG